MSTLTSKVLDGNSSQRLYALGILDEFLIKSSMDLELRFHGKSGL